MSKQTYLPPSLTLFPLPAPHVLYPFLQVTVTLPTDVVSHILATLAEQADVNKLDSRDRFVAAIPVGEGDRRVGRWACAARIRRIYRADPKDETEGWTCVLEGLARIHLPRSLPPLISILPPLPLTVTSYALPMPSSAPSVDLMPAAIKLLPQELHGKLATLPASVQADLLASTLRFPWDVRVELLATPNIDDRTVRVRELLLDLLSSKGIAPPDENSTPAPKQLQRRPAQHIAPAPKSQLPEDLRPLEALALKRKDELSKAANEALTRELTRLAKIPAQAAEYGVGKTYCEWLLALPWYRVTEGKRLNLDTARKMLDEDHEGLQDVKRRVIEYLAVYRLKRDLWEEKQVREQKSGDEDKSGQLASGAQTPLSTSKEIVPYDPNKAAKAMAKPADEPSAPAESESDFTVEDTPPDNIFRDKAPILLLVGPPGVGKTSIARSIAESLGRKFHRISLGGVRDEAEIRGHRRTYVGALPGLFVQGLRKVGVSNPVILLDELDKVGQSNYHGDPSAALLETLDPAQNWTFHDHYLGDVPIDLSQVTFIATANSLDTISAPLLDRCEVIECPGYITDEKLAIARRFLLPKQTKENGLEEVRAADEVLERVVSDYTREAGVRTLEREIAKLCRAKAVQYSNSRDGGDKYDPEVKLEDLESILGMAKYEAEVREATVRPGVVTGLAYRGSGNGGILIVESTLVPGGKGRLHLTGQLGDVIRESAEVALAWVRAHAPALGIEDPLKDVDIHLHLPSGAVKKDGPSAGVAMILAFVSLLTGRTVPPTMAFTGEITLRGAVTAVGGIREKVLGAHRAGITQVVLPGQNEKDTHELPPSVQKMRMTYVRTVEGLLEEVWGQEVWPRELKPKSGKASAS
ncbi:hypothetical protein CspeluHIS016_0603950 [Cutaneotrichosporon spelunceum]|uniref:endopeptidase La n=1 Tax=Cutaneotrichosporon spelunceum TaxID=1672016 RepID=A0AAD3TY79_9TREE|nr:hypothetical protein CspeluHIS016_0603950 [Cutaneotrichosporon spelunceum]